MRIEKKEVRRTNKEEENKIRRILVLVNRKHKSQWRDLKKGLEHNTLWAEPEILWRIPCPSSPLSRPPYQLSFPVQTCTSSYSLFAFLNPGLQGSAHTKYQTCWGQRKHKWNHFQSNFWIPTRKVWKWNFQWSEPRAVVGSREVELLCQLLSLPWVLMSDRLARCSCCTLRSLRRLHAVGSVSPGVLEKLFVLCSYWRSKGKTRSKTPPGPQTTKVSGESQMKEALVAERAKSHTESKKKVCQKLGGAKKENAKIWQETRL